MRGFFAISRGLFQKPMWRALLFCFIVLGSGISSLAQTNFAGHYVGTYTVTTAGFVNNFASINFEFNTQGQLVDIFGTGGRLGFGRPNSFSGSVDANGNASWTLFWPGVIENWSGKFSEFSAGGVYQSDQPANATWHATRGVSTLPKDSMRMVSDPVDAGSGAYTTHHAWLKQNAPNELAFDFEYNSASLETGRLGVGWGHNFEMRIDSVHTNELIFNWNQQRRNYFNRIGAGNTYSCSDRAMRYDVLTNNANGTFTLKRADQSRMEFNTNGLLAQIVNPHGQPINLTYSNSILTNVVEVISKRFLAFTYDASGRISQVADTLGRKVVFSYDANDRLTACFLQDAASVNAAAFAYSYDSAGRILQAQDLNGVVFVSNTYDVQGRVVAQEDARTDNQPTRFYYDDATTPGRRIVKVTDRNGQTYVNTFDRDFLLVAFQNQNGETTTYTYDADGNRLSMTDPLNRTMTNSYDAQGNVLTITDPSLAVTSMTYDSQNNLIKIHNSLLKDTTFGYDTTNNLTAVTNALNQVVNFTYSTNSLLTRRVSARNGLTDYTYTNGLPASVKDANNLMSTMAYDLAGRLMVITDPAGKTNAMTYNASDDVLTVTDPLGHVTSFTYDFRRRKLSESDPLLQKTQWAYDGNGDLIAKTDALTNITRYAYDGEGRPIRIIDARGNVSRLAYDPAGRLQNLTDGAGQARTIHYDPSGNVTQVGDARDNFFRSVYNNRNLPVSTEDALNRVSLMNYDSKRRLTQSTNALGQVLNLSYDDLDRVIQVTDPLNQVTKQVFDADGNRIGLANARNGTNTFAYDLGGRLTNSVTPGGRTNSYTYTARNLPATVVEPSAQTTTMTFDDARRLIRTVDPTGQIDYTYDNANRLLVVTNGGLTLTRVYDALGRLTQFTDANTNILKYGYDTVGNLLTLSYPDNKQVLYTYDAANRMTSVTDWSNRVTSYTYDVDGRLATTTRPNGTVETRTWDEAGQLTQISDVKGAATIVAFTFVRDPVGRIVTENPQPVPGVYSPTPLTAIYDTDNRLINFNATASGFDVDGNLTNGPVVNGTGNSLFVYDSRNRLVSFGGITNGYDAENRRISLADATGTTRFVHNPNVALSQLLTRTAPNGTITRAVYGLGLLYEETGATVRYFHYDYRGTAVAFSDTSGSVIGRVEYGPYGEISARSGDSATPFLFNARDGVQTDTNGLYCMRARFYHPTERRFVNQDVVLGDISAGATLNRFAYANGNPISLTDPFGLDAFDYDTTPKDLFGTGRLFDYFNNAFNQSLTLGNLNETATTFDELEHFLDLANALATEYGSNIKSVKNVLPSLDDLHGVIGRAALVLNGILEATKVDRDFVLNQPTTGATFEAFLYEWEAASDRLLFRIPILPVFTFLKASTIISYPLIGSEAYHRYMGNISFNEDVANQYIDRTFTGVNFQNAYNSR